MSAKGMCWLTQRSQNGTRKLPKMRLFLGKSTLFVHPLCRQQGVLSWKMIACHHSKVHLTGGYAPRFLAVFLAQASSVKMVLSRPSRQQVTQTVGQFLAK